jgi:uncharacterized membrane protein YdbT with pleckstrin-like domain
VPTGDRFDRYLLEGERRVLEFTYHWMYLTKPVALFAGSMVVGAALVTISDQATFAWVVLVGALLWFGLPLLSAIENRAAVRLIITDSRVVFVEGWLARRYGMMPLTKITDLTIHEPVLGRILGYGTIIAESAGQDQALTQIRYLPDPLTAWHTISDLLYVQGAVRPGYRRPDAVDSPFPGPEPTTPSPR